MGRNLPTWIARLATLFIAGWLLAAPARAEWFKAESPNFILYSQSGEAEARALIELLEDYDRLLRFLTDTRAPSSNKLSVYMVRGAHQLRTVRPSLSSGAAGFYSVSAIGIAAFADETVRFTDNPEKQRFQVLFHEYAHHFMMQYFPAAYPPWFVEGFAEFMMNSTFDEDYVEYGGIADGRAYQLTMGGEWLDIDRVLFQSHRLRGPDLAKFYAQSWIIVHYLYRDPDRRAALTRYLAAFGQGEDPRAAFETAFGMTPGQLGVAVRRYASGRGIPVTRIPRGSISAPPAITVTRMPASTHQLLLLDAAMRINPMPNVALDLLERIRREAAAYPNDPYAKRVLARAEAFYGDGDMADRLLAELLAGTPEDAELLYLRGMRHLVAARLSQDKAAHFAAARRWFARAYRADPNHFPTLASYAESLQGEENFVSDNTMNVLLRAHQLAPQVNSITFDAAAIMMNRDQFEAAERLLAPLAADTHSRATAEFARRLIQQARQRERPELVGTEPEPTPEQPMRMAFLFSADPLGDALE